MLRSRFSPALILAALACSDAPTAPFGPSPEPADDPGYQTIRGTVVSPTLLFADDGSHVPLEGPQTVHLEALIGAEILIHAAPDEIGGMNMWIIEFRVLAVDGLPAVDGHLDAADEGFAIRSWNGDVVMLHELPDDLASHVGSRVWLTILDGSPIRYGVIAE